MVPYGTVTLKVGSVHSCVCKYRTLLETRAQLQALAASCFNLGAFGVEHLTRKDAGGGMLGENQRHCAMLNAEAAAASPHLSRTVAICPTCFSRPFMSRHDTASLCSAASMK